MDGLLLCDRPVSRTLHAQAPAAAEEKKEVKVVKKPDEVRNAPRTPPLLRGRMLSGVSLRRPARARSGGGAFAMRQHLRHELVAGITSTPNASFRSVRPR